MVRADGTFTLVRLKPPVTRSGRIDAADLAQLRQVMAESGFAGLPQVQASGGGADRYTYRITYRGQQYYRGNIPELAYYNHTMTPNTTLLDCGDVAYFISAHMAARSYHPGGVNALLADGSVKFFKKTISVAVWRALSTTTGGEVVSADSY